MSASAGAATLVGVLRERAATDQAGGYRFVHDTAEPAEALSFAQLEHRARDVAAELAMSVPPGGRAVLVYPPGLDFIIGFFGALYAGVAPVPVYPPGGANMEQALSRLEHVVTDARPDAVLTTGALLAAKDAAKISVGPASMRWLATDGISPGLGAGWTPPALSADDAALVQYTSGSTASPKGVVVRHRQVLANLEAIRTAMGLGADSVAASWVPSYHDMGLIGFILEALYAGFSSYLIAPQDFLRRPALWLETITRNAGVVSGGPNFGFELCTRRVTEQELERCDLSSWQVAFSGAERVRPDVLRRFCSRFRAARFDARAIYPCYGLAEASLFVSGTPRGRGLASVWADRRGTEEGVVRPAAPGTEGAAEIASCGQVAAGHRVVIADPDTRRPAAPGTVGEIWFGGPSVASGYWRQRPESDAVFRARLADGDGPFLRTGDLGFMRDGELYLTGRRKDLMVIQGRNVYPTDVEDAVQATDRRLRPGCGASFLLGDDSTDMIIVQETTEEHPDELRKLALTVRRAVLERLNVAVADVVLAHPRTILKTSSGKLRRRACREDYLAGRLDVKFRLRPAEPVSEPVEA